MFVEMLANGRSHVHVCERERVVRCMHVNVCVFVCVCVYVKESASQRHAHWHLCACVHAQVPLHGGAWGPGPGV